MWVVGKTGGSRYVQLQGILSNLTIWTLFGSERRIQYRDTSVEDVEVNAPIRRVWQKSVGIFWGIESRNDGLLGVRFTPGYCDEIVGDED